MIKINCEENRQFLATLVFGKKWFTLNGIITAYKKAKGNCIVDGRLSIKSYVTGLEESGMVVNRGDRYYISKDSVPVMSPFEENRQTLLRVIRMLVKFNFDKLWKHYLKRCRRDTILIDGSQTAKQFLEELAELGFLEDQGGGNYRLLRIT